MLYTSLLGLVLVSCNIVHLSTAQARNMVHLSNVLTSWKLSHVVTDLTKDVKKLGFIGDELV